MHSVKNFLPTKSLIVELHRSPSAQWIGTAMCQTENNRRLRPGKKNVQMVLLIRVILCLCVQVVHDLEHFETKEHGHQRVKDLCHSDKRVLSCFSSLKISRRSGPSYLSLFDRRSRYKSREDRWGRLFSASHCARWSLLPADFFVISLLAQNLVL